MSTVTIPMEDGWESIYKYDKKGNLISHQINQTKKKTKLEKNK